jgi:DNA-binding MurR/RpiR family transcriptional regulator
MVHQSARDSLPERIRGLGRLTTSETKIADFLQRTYPEVVFETATSIAQNAGVSKATVVRFVSRLGYRGFAHFQGELQREIHLRLENPLERFPWRKKQIRERGDDYLGENIACIIRNLRKTHERVDARTFMEVARIIALGAGTLYIVSNLGSFGLAYYFWYYLHYVRDRTCLLTNLGSSLPNQLFHVTSDDALFLITYRRYSRQTQLVAEHFARKGAKILLLSDVEVTPFSPLADLILVAPSEAAFMFESRCACLAVLESLLTAVTHLLEDTLEARFKSADGALEHFGALVPGPLAAGGWRNAVPSNAPGGAERRRNRSKTR